MRCIQAVLDFLSTMVLPAKEDAGSEASEWERREREEERRQEAEEGEEPLFLPTPSFMASAGEE